jgi:hypothetical protein
VRGSYRVLRAGLYATPAHVRMRINPQFEQSQGALNGMPKIDADAGEKATSVLDPTSISRVVASG